MKIAFVTPLFSAHERDWCVPWRVDHVRAVARHARVHVFPLRWPERGGPYDVFGARVHASGARPLRVQALRRWTRTIAMLAAEHRREPFTVVHGTLDLESALLAVVAGRRLRVPVALSVTDAALVDPWPARSTPAARWCRVAILFALGRATCITVGSRDLDARLRHILPPEVSERIVPAPFGVDTCRFARGRAAFDLPSGPWLSVGPLTAPKNHRLALDVLAGMTDRLVIAGGGPLRRDLEKYAGQIGVAGRVQWLGHVPHDIMPSVYRASSFTLHTPSRDAQGMAVLEAAACGVPVIGTAVGVLPELLPADCELPLPDDGPRAVSALAALARELGASPRQSRRLAEHARAVVDARFSLARTSARFLEIYAASERDGVQSVLPARASVQQSATRSGTSFCRHSDAGTELQSGLRGRPETVPAGTIDVPRANQA
jgi:glycosyltransferase involved in cell wall biosynthesis